MLQRLKVFLVGVGLGLQFLLVLLLEVLHFHQDVSNGLLGLVRDHLVLLQLLLLHERERYVAVCGHGRRLHNCGMDLKGTNISNTLNSLIWSSKGKGCAEVAQRRGRLAPRLQILDVVVHVFQCAAPLDVGSDGLLPFTDVYASDHERLLVSDFWDRDQLYVVWRKLLSTCVNRNLNVARVEIYVDYLAQTEHKLLLVER